MRRLVLLAVLVAPSAAVAQQQRFTVDAGGSSVRYADSLDVTTLSLSPAFSVQSRRGSLAAMASLSQLSGGGWSNSGTLNGTVAGPGLGRLGTEFVGSLGGSAHRDGARTGQWLGMAQLVLDASQRGLWGGGGVGGTWDGFAWRRVAQGTVGGWLAAPMVSAALSASPTVVDDTIGYTDLLLRLRRNAGLFELAGSVGSRLGDPIPGLAESSLWGSLSATAWVRPTVGIVASAGTYPVDFTQGFPGGRFFSVAMRMALPRGQPSFVQAGRSPAVLHGEARAFEARRINGDSYRVRIHAPAAQRAEIAGDFTNWRTVAMAAEANGWWSITLPIRSGTHQMNVRFDGGPWRVPPGLVAVTDEFGGVSGVLVVP